MSRTLLGQAPYDFGAVKEAYPLLEVVERVGVKLRRAGPGTFQGLCPFHEERTPSFTVYVEQQRFVCFGCKVKGDVLDFVQLHEHLASVAEACVWLTGTPPPPPLNKHESRPEPPHRDRRWDRLTLEQQLVLNAAGMLYRDALWRNPMALHYLHQRGIPDWIIRACGLGYADGRSLEAHLRRHGGLRVAEDLGLLRRPETRGSQPIWFIGRAPNERQVKVKYLALPGEKPILGFERAAGRREAYLIEGVFDWLTAVTWNLPAFSTCGTDFPFDRLGWLARARVIFGVLDADRAGHEAAERFGAALGARWRPLELPPGLDLNELGCRPDGRRQFFRLVAEARRELEAIGGVRGGTF